MQWCGLSSATKWSWTTRLAKPVGHMMSYVGHGWSWSRFPTLTLEETEESNLSACPATRHDIEQPNSTKCDVENKGHKIYPGGVLGWKLEAPSCFLISITFARDPHPGDSHVMSWQKMSKRKNETWSNHVLHSCHHEHCFRGRSTCLCFILNMKEIWHISNLPLRVDKHRSHVACSFTNFCCLIMIKAPSLEELLHNSSNPDAKRTKKRNTTSICPTFVCSLVTLRCITHSTGKRRCHRSQQPIEKAWSCASTRNSLSPGHSKSITDFSAAAKQKEAIHCLRQWALDSQR